MTTFVLWMLVLLSIVTAVRMVIGPTLWDRLLGFSQFSAILVLVLVFHALVNQQEYLLDVAITYVLLGFIGIVFMARFIRDRGRGDAE